MKVLNCILLFLVIISTGIFAQSPMQPGFTMLEKGEFAEAKVFFEDYLKTDAENKTARLCYGRAMGLSGSSEAATDLFKDLLVEYPGDLELGLNFAESYLWRSDFQSAEREFKALLQDHPTNFPALLGYANTQSNLQNYELAREYINKALEIDPGNGSAEVSKKFILLGLANQQTKAGEYQSAMDNLNIVLELFPDDKSALLNKAINYILWDKHANARAIYSYILDQDIDELEGYLGLSYVNLLMNHPRRSFDFAEKASEYIKTHDVSEPLALKTKINLVNAYGVKGKFKTAFSLLEQIEVDHGDERDVKLARARMNLWSRDKEASKEYYDQLLVEYPETYDVYMGYVDVMRAHQQDGSAMEYLNSSLDLVPGQPDVVRLISDVDRANSPHISLNYHRGEDNGGNLSNNLLLDIQFNSFKKIEPFVSFKNRTSYTEADRENKLSIPRFLAGAKWTIDPNTSLKGSMGLAINSSEEIESKTKPNTSIELSRLVAKHHNFTLKYFTDFQDFTSGLVSEDLSSGNIELDYFVSSFTGPGFYSQFIYTTQNDDNTRFLMFLSPYVDFNKVPNIKAGVNYLYMAYDFSRPTVYFSPTKYYSLEAFASTQNDGNRKAKILYRGFAAIGTQKIEDQDNQSTIRLEGELGYRHNKDFEIKGFYTYSNAAQSSATGFSYSTVGVKVSYYVR